MGLNANVRGARIRRVIVRPAQQVPEIYTAIAHNHGVCNERIPLNAAGEFDRNLTSKIPVGSLVFTVEYTPEQMAQLPREWVPRLKAALTWSALRRWWGENRAQSAPAESVDNVTHLITSLGTTKELMLIHDAVPSIAGQHAHLYLPGGGVKSDYYTMGNPLKWPGPNGTPEYNKTLDPQLTGNLVSNVIRVHYLLVKDKIKEGPSSRGPGEEGPFGLDLSERLGDKEAKVFFEKDIEESPAAVANAWKMIRAEYSKRPFEIDTRGLSPDMKKHFNIAL